MSKCDCKAFPHDEWCSSHPLAMLREERDELRQNVDDLLFDKKDLLGRIGQYEAHYAHANRVWQHENYWRSVAEIIERYAVPTAIDVNEFATKLASHLGIMPKGYTYSNTHPKPPAQGEP